MSKRQFPTLAEFLTSKSSNPTVNDTVEFQGYSVIGDGGAATWQYNGVTGETPSQSPAQLGGALLNDGNGNQWSLVVNGIMSALVLGASTASSDNSAELNAAVTSFECYIPDGVFFGAVITPKHSISGTGTIKKPVGSGGANVLLIDSVSDVKVSGITVDGNKSAATGFTNTQVTNSNNVTIDNVTTTNAKGHGVSLTNSTNSRVTNSTSSLNDAEGLEVRSSTTCLIEGNVVFDNLGHGVSLSKDVNINQNVSISKNKVNNNSRAGIHVPFNTNSLDPNSVDVNVSDNLVNNNGENGFLMQQTRGAISGNTSRSNGTLTIHQGFVINASDVTVSDNISEFNSGVGIDFGNSYKATCTGNLIRGNGIIGLEINSSEDVTATGNLITGNYASNPVFTYQAGLVVNGKGAQWPTISSKNINVSGNIIKAGPNQTHGLSIEESVQVHVSNNSMQLSGTVSDIRVDNMFEYDFELTNNKTASQPTASATTLVVDSDVKYFSVNSNAGQIDTISRDGLQVLQKGDELVIRFFVAGIVVGHLTGNINLGGANYTSTTNSTLTLLNLGGTWFKTSST